jgi:predicted thioesterase
MTGSATVEEVLERRCVFRDPWSTPTPGAPELRVLPIPASVEASEPACKALVERYIEEDERPLNFRQLAPTPAGTSSKVKARLSGAGQDGYEFDVDTSGRTGEGGHTRSIVKLDGFRKRTRSKVPGHP